MSPNGCGLHQKHQGRVDLEIFRGIVRARESAIETGDQDKVVGESKDVVQHCIKIDFTIGTNQVFEGACVDFGAQKVCIGVKQAQKYCTMMGEPWKVNGSNLVFKFGDKSHEELGTMQIKIPLSSYKFVEQNVHVINADVPFLLGLDVMKKLKMIVDFDSDTASSKLDSWTLPMTQKLGYAYIQ